MDLKKITSVTVTYEDGTTETFVGDVGAVSDYASYIKDHEGKHHQKLKIVTTTLTTERSDWIRGPIPVGP